MDTLRLLCVPSPPGWRVLCGLSLFLGLTSLITIFLPQALCAGLRRRSLRSIPTVTFNSDFPSSGFFLLISGLAPIDPSVRSGLIAHFKTADPNMSLYS